MAASSLGLSGRWTVFLLCALMFTSGADMLVMTPILPQVAKDLGVEVELGGLWVTAYAVATGVFALIFGPISDRHGRKPILVGGMVVLAAGTLACGFAYSYATMIAARAFAGMGAGLLVTSTTSYVGDHFPEQHRAVVMGYVMSGFFLSLILGVPIGAGLTAWVGWNHMFLILTGFALLVTALLIFTLPHPAEEKRTVHLSVGGALGGYLTLLRDKKVLGILCMSAAIGMSMTTFSVYSSPWMEQTFGLGTRDRGLVYAIGGPAVLLGGPLAGKLSDRFGRVWIIVLGSALMGVMQVAMPFSVIPGGAIRDALDAHQLDFARFGDLMWPATLPTLAIFFFAMLAGSSRSAPFQTLALEVVEPEQRGALAAIRNTFNQGGSGLGAALGSVVWASSSDGYRAVCLLSASVTVLGVVAMTALVGVDRPRRVAGGRGR